MCGASLRVSPWSCGRVWQSPDRLAKPQGNDRATRSKANQFIDPDAVVAFRRERALRTRCPITVHRPPTAHGFEARLGFQADAQALDAFREALLARSETPAHEPLALRAECRARREAELRLVHELLAERQAVGHALDAE